MSVWANGQILDTSDAHNYKSLEVYTVSVDGINDMNLDSALIDTLMFQFYDHYELFKSSGAYIDLGYEGSATLLLSSPAFEEMSTRLYLSAYEPILRQGSIQLYHTKTPWTRFNYTQGSNNLTYINGHHGQQFSERLSIGFDYERLSNHNYYYSNISNADRANLTDLYNTRFFGAYYTTDRRYEMTTSYTWINMQNLVSGGLTDLPFFEQTSGRTRLNNQAAQLSNANNLQNLHKLELTQYIRAFGKDSTKHHLSDYSSQWIINSMISSGIVQYEDNSPDSSFYRFTTGPINDSLKQQSINNSISYARKFGASSLILGVEHDHTKLFNGFTIHILNSSYLKVQGHHTVSKGITNIRGHGRFGLTGYNALDHHFELAASHKSNIWESYITVTEQNTTPSLLYQNNHAALYQWTSTLDKVSTLGLDGEVSLRVKGHKFGVNIQARSMSNMIYFMENDYAIHQSDEQISYFTGMLWASHGGRSGGYKLSVSRQYSSNQEVLPRPKWNCELSTYVQFRLFHKKLTTQIGAETRWFSEFNAPRYNPYTRQWHNTSDAFSYTPPLQLFMNAKIKNVCASVQAFHIQDGFVGESLYGSPFYPQTPRSLRFSLRWDFNN